MVHELGRVRWVSLAIVALLAGCGGGDDSGAASASSAVGLGSTVAATDSTDTTPTSAASSADASTGPGDTPAGPLPDACTLLSSESVASAIGGTPRPSQPQKPNEISSRCVWSPGDAHSLNLDVRAGTNAETTFNNTIVGGFTQVPLAPAEGWVSVGRAANPIGTTGSLCSKRTTAPTTSISRCRGPTGTMARRRRSRRRWLPRCTRRWGDHEPDLKQRISISLPSGRRDRSTTGGRSYPRAREENRTPDLLTASYLQLSAVPTGEARGSRGRDNHVVIACRRHPEAEVRGVAATPSAARRLSQLGGGVLDHGLDLQRNLDGVPRRPEPSTARTLDDWNLRLVSGPSLVLVIDGAFALLEAQSVDGASVNDELITSWSRRDQVGLSSIRQRPSQLRHCNLERVCTRVSHAFPERVDEAFGRDRLSGFEREQRENPSDLRASQIHWPAPGRSDLDGAQQPDLHGRNLVNGPCSNSLLAVGSRPRSLGRRRHDDRPCSLSTPHASHDPGTHTTGRGDHPHPRPRGPRPRRIYRYESMASPPIWVRVVLDDQTFLDDIEAYCRAARLRTRRPLDCARLVTSAARTT